MNSFFIEFRDPLFGIIVFFALIFIITFVSYWWNKFRTKEDYRYLDKFLRQFRSPPSQEELQNLIVKGKLPTKSWMLLAKSYYGSGDYEKTIEIYNELLKLEGLENRRDIFFLLGQTYFKAGFLQRAKEVFLQILKTNPRTPQALNALLLVYEHIKDYDMALEVLASLEELKQDTTKTKDYLLALSILNSKDEIQLKTKKLLEIYQKQHHLTYLIFEYLFRVNPKIAWQNLDASKVEVLSDVFWRLDKSELDFDAISKNGYLRELYSARGDVDMAEQSLVFEFDVLIALKDRANATLNFEYICNNCKQVYPFAFYRCNHCHSIDDMSVEMILSKDYHRNFSEENNSFQ